MRSSLGRGPAFAPIVTIAASIVMIIGAFAPAYAGGKPGSGGGRPKRDTSPPAVSLSAPTGGSTLSGDVAVAGTASDNVGVVSVTVRVDGGNAQTATGTSSWSYSLDTRGLSNGSHTITSTAVDAAGNSGTSSVGVTIDNSEPEPSPTPTPTPTPPPSGTPVPAPALAPGSIGGWTFKDLNRNGVYESGEEPFTGQHLYLFSSAGGYLGQAYSDATGWYTFTGRADGDYQVAYDSSSWAPLKHDWVPSTTGSVRPEIAVHLAGTARADFGWRPIVWSTDASAPIATYVGPNGMRVQAYNDAVPPVRIYDAVMTGTVGQEAGSVTIRFAYGSVSATSTSVVSSGGVYSGFSATAYVSYDAWLETPLYTLSHEYGHAWSWYYAFMVQQDETMAGYLAARGLSGDARVGSSYAWGVGEMIAEDYRQLLGPVGGRAYAQANSEIPPAAQVPGLAEYLSNTFTRPPA